MTAAAIHEALACGKPGCPCHRGRATHCPAHDDRRPSLAVDERGGRVLVHCRAGCPQDRVLAALRLRGLWPAPAPSRPARPRSLLAEALARVQVEGERQRRRLEPYRHLFVIADHLRPRFQAIAEARKKLATGLGPTERAWELLDLAARVEAEGLAIEGEADERLALDYPLAPVLRRRRSA